MRLHTALLAFLLLPAVTVPISAAQPQAKAAPINVTATADQTFAPATITLHVGKPQVIHFTSSGGVHGVESKDLGIPATMLMPGKPVDVTVTPTKVGTYKLPCTIVCGTNHATMILTVQVNK